MTDIVLCAYIVWFMYTHLHSVGQRLDLELIEVQKSF